MIKNQRWGRDCATEPLGLADAFIVSREFVGSEQAALVRPTRRTADWRRTS
jgi:hypothetical protein